jgi:hypothetical protein
MLVPLVEMKEKDRVDDALHATRSCRRRVLLLVVVYLLRAKAY